MWFANNLGLFYVQSQYNPLVANFYRIGGSVNIYTLSIDSKAHITVTYNQSYPGTQAHYVVDLCGLIESIT